MPKVKAKIPKDPNAFNCGLEMQRVKGAVKYQLCVSACADISGHVTWEGFGGK